jgi:hypothetical protein
MSCILITLPRAPKLQLEKNHDFQYMYNVYTYNTSARGLLCSIGFRKSHSCQGWTRAVYKNLCSVVCARHGQDTSAGRNATHLPLTVKYVSCIRNPRRYPISSLNVCVLCVCVHARRSSRAMSSVVIAIIPV